MSIVNNASEFIRKLSEDDGFRKEIGPELLQIKEGDWDGIVRVAESYGLPFSKEELLAVVPENFFKGKGQDPRAGWDENTRSL